MKKLPNLKKPLGFSLSLLPVAVLAVLLVSLYQFDLYDSSVLEDAISQVGSLEMVLLVTVIQNAVFIFAACFFGYILADKLGLLRPLRFEKHPLGITLIWAVVSGVVLAGDYWTFGAVEPALREGTEAGLTVYGVLSAILYGGVVEELLMRLFCLSLIAWLLWKLLFRKEATPPAKVILAANLLATLLFAAGHLPATYVTFGGLTPLLLVRCFLLNGTFGFLFGELYRRYGLQYAMVCHAGAHMVSKLIFFCFL